MELKNKITEIIANWSNLSSKVTEKQKKVYSDGIDDWQWLLKEAPEEIDSMEDIQKFVDQIYPLLKKERKHKFKTEKGGKITSRRKKGEKKTEKKSRKRKYGTMKGKYKVVKSKKNEPKEEPKKTTKKSTKTKVAEAPNWVKTLRSFKRIVKKTKTRNSIRNYIITIQDRFDKKRGLSTPCISIIREIQKVLLPFANSSDTHVDIPPFDEIVEKINVALKTIVVSNKLTKSKLKATELAGPGYQVR